MIAMRQFLATVLLAAGAGSAFAQTTQPVKLDKPLDFENVGLRIAFPPGLPLSAPDGPSVLWAAWQNQDDPKDFIILYAFGFPADKAPPLKEWTEGFLVRQRRDSQPQPAVASSAEFKVGRLDGWQAVGRVASAQRKGVETVTVWTRPAATEKTVFYFALAVGLGSDDIPAAVARAKVICDSVEVIPLKSPSSAELPPLVIPVKVEGAELSLRTPAGWYVSQAAPQGNAQAVFTAAAVDYAAGKALPSLNVTAVRVNTGTAKAFGSDEYAKSLADELAKANKALNWTTVSTGKLRVDGRAAVHVVSRLDLAGDQCVQVQVQALDEGRIISLSLSWRGADVAPARLAMNKLLREVKFVAGATTATSRMSPNANK